MSRWIPLFIVCLWAVPALAEDIRVPSQAATTLSATSGELSNRQMEEDLQRMTWSQFRSVVESVPKLKADIDAYGQTGWQYVQANYTTYRWRKNIKRLDNTQKEQLAELIRLTKDAR
jgi:hypothetical protein